MKAPEKSTATGERALFMRALECTTPTERAAFLEAACAGDAPLRRRLEALLRKQGELGEFLELPVLSAPDTTGENPTTGEQSEEPTSVTPFMEKAGDRIGRYKLLEQTGEGGFGVVWMAEQEQPVRLRVALKIIKSGMAWRVNRLQIASKTAAPCTSFWRTTSAGRLERIWSKGQRRSTVRWFYLANEKEV